MATSAEIRRRSKRLELRTTPEERELIERAAEGDALACEAVNARRARDLPGLRDLMSRPSPFAE